MDAYGYHRPKRPVVWDSHTNSGEQLERATVAEAKLRRVERAHEELQKRLVERNQELIAAYKQIEQLASEVKDLQSKLKTYYNPSSEPAPKVKLGRKAAR